MNGPRRAVVVALACAGSVLAPARASGDEAEATLPVGFSWLPGATRAIARTTSASRDTPLFELAYGPRAQASIGGEFGVAAYRTSHLTGRAGMYAMIGLENGDDDKIFPPHELWRGLVGLSGAVALDRLARDWFGPGAQLELGLTLGHESDHGDVHDRPRPWDLPFGGGGDFAAPDLATRLAMGRRATVDLRLADRIYVRGSIAQAPSADLVLRVPISATWQPVLALFAEQLIARDQEVRSGFFARALIGPAIRGRVGEVTPFVSFDAGAGKGLLINRREARTSFGIRYAPF